MLISTQQGKKQSKKEINKLMTFFKMQVFIVVEC